MVLVRFFLIGLIVFLILRSFASSVGGERPSSQNDGQSKNPDPPGKKVSKEIGEYVDYEEVKK
jgi:hypothetical protein